MQPNAEMSYCHVGFDLKAAREICIKLDLRYPARSLVDIDYQCALAAEMLPAALDEIERLEAARLKAQNSNLPRKQAYESLEKIANKQRAALKKLGQAKRERGKALVEERAHCYLNLERNADIVTWDLDEVSENEQKRLRYEAREQLRLEDKL